MPTDLFISHCTQDAEAAHAVRAACEAAGLSCWIAPRDIAAGSEWAEAIVGALRDAGIVVLIHSAAANASPMVRREIDIAANARKPILPVRIDGAMPGQALQFYLSNTHWFDASPPIAPHLPRLIEAIARLRATPPPAAFPEFAVQGAIGVLPFRTQTQADDVFAEGLTDELITALSAWRNFPVIARTSMVTYRNRDVDLRTLRAELGVRYVLYGRIQHRDGAVRVALELADVESNQTLLSDSYDHAEDDPQAIQDEIVRAIAGTLGPEVMKLERDRLARQPPEAPTAYALFQRGMWHRYRDTREDLEKAETLFRAALDINPDYARALAALSLCRNFAAISRWTDDIASAHADSLSLARRAATLDPRDPHARFALGVAYMNHQRLTDGIAELREAIRLNPSHAFARANLGQCYNRLNRPEEGLAEIDAALRLNPHDPRRFMWLPYRAASHYLVRRYRDCLAACQEALEANPQYPLAVRYMAAALGQLGRTSEAAALLPLMRRIDGDFAGLESLTRRMFVPDAADHLLEGFRAAGFA